MMCWLPARIHQPSLTNHFSLRPTLSESRPTYIACLNMSGGMVLTFESEKERILRNASKGALSALDPVEMKWRPLISLKGKKGGGGSDSSVRQKSNEIRTVLNVDLYPELRLHYCILFLLVVYVNVVIDGKRLCATTLAKFDNIFLTREKQNQRKIEKFDEPRQISVRSHWSC